MSVQAVIINKNDVKYGSVPEGHFRLLIGSTMSHLQCTHPTTGQKRTDWASLWAQHCIDVYEVDSVAMLKDGQIWKWHEKNGWIL